MMGMDLEELKKLNYPVALKLSRSIPPALGFAFSHSYLYLELQIEWIA